MTDVPTLETIVAAKRLLKPFEVDGSLFYGIIMHPTQLHDIEVMRARQNWRDYYRSVRILRNIRKQDAAKFKRFSQAWWRLSLRGEFEKEHPQDGRFGLDRVSLADRLKWLKLKKKVQTCSCGQTIGDCVYPSCGGSMPNEWRRS